jgi:hypothetical protein
MKQNSVFVHHLQDLSLLPLEMTLKEAKLFSPPDVHEPQANVDEQLAASLIERVKRQHRWTSPFVSWMGQPFPDEYREMVAADVRRG